MKPRLDILFPSRVLFCSTLNLLSLEMVSSVHSVNKQVHVMYMMHMYIPNGFFVNGGAGGAESFRMRLV